MLINSTTLIESQKTSKDGKQVSFANQRSHNKRDSKNIKKYQRFWLSNFHNFYTATDVRDHISKQISFSEYPSLITVRAWMKDELEMSI